MPNIDEGGYLITPREFEERMASIFNDRSLDEYDKHVDMDAVMRVTLESLGYGAGIKIYKRLEKYYAKD